MILWRFRDQMERLYRSAGKHKEQNGRLMVD